MERCRHWHLFFTHHYLVSRLEKIADQTHDRKSCQRKKNPGEIKTMTWSHIPRARERSLAQRNFYWTVQRSRKVHSRGRSTRRVPKTCKNLRPSWVEETTPISTMGPRYYTKNRCIRHTRLQIISSTTKGRQNLRQVAWRRRRQGLHQIINITNHVLIFLPPKSQWFSKTCTRL